MNSRLIYTIVNSGKLNIEWKLDIDSEWIYIGIGEELKKEKVTSQIQNIFNSENLYIVLGRENSKEILINEVNTEILNRIGNENFKICDKDFTKFIEFNKIGIMRIGTKKYTTDNTVENDNGS
jgi:hypothetical protein